MCEIKSRESPCLGFFVKNPVDWFAQFFTYFDRGKMFIKELLLILALTSVLISVASQQCGVPSKTVSLIHRGSEFYRGKWPWMAALLLKVDSEQRFFCAGVLISKKKILTAAHCIQDKNRERFKTRDIFILLGAHDLNNRNLPGSYLTAPSEIFIHPDWNPNVEKYDADIAVMMIEHDVPFNQFIKPVCVATSDMKSAVTGYVTGWGKSEDESKAHENIPKELTIPIWTNEHCFHESIEFLAISSRRTMCAGNRDESGVCNGDSGGGLFVESNGVYFVTGIVSASLLKAGKCDVSNFAAFTDVTKFIPWIESPESQPTSEDLSKVCGVMSSSAGLIQKGKKSSAVQWPWAVIITIKGWQYTIDGDTYPTFEIGSLVSAKHVIGDGYFNTEVDGEKRKTVPNDAITTYYGVTNIDEYASSNSLVLDGVEKIFVHPNLGNIHSLKFANFAILKLKTSVTFSQYISPVCISSFTGDPYSLTGRFAYAVGMGYSETGKTKDRKYSPMRIRSKEICDVEYEFSLGTAKNRDHYFCAGGDGKMNACWSDHPLYMKLNNKWYLHAFLQVAYNEDKGCSTTLPVLYETAGVYSAWIQSHISSLD